MKLIDLEKINLDNSLIEIITDMINQPIIDAIPVKWIKRHIAELRAEVERKIEEENYTDYGLCDDAYGMERLLADWEKEKSVKISERNYDSDEEYEKQMRCLDETN